MDSRTVGARILKGEKNYWFLGPGGVARLRDHHVTCAGDLLPDAERKLRDRGLLAATPRSTYSLTVLTSTDCNLGCGYCFQNTGQDPRGGARPPRIAHSRLTSETITSILDFTDRQMSAAGLNELRILLFGGEPLLNPLGCLEMLSRAADHGLSSAWMISNLVLLTPRLAERLENVGLSSIQVTFDGDRAHHDQTRIRRSTGGTFDTIVGNIVRASSATSINWILRVNVSHHNVAGIDKLIERLAGTIDPGRCAIYFAPVGDIGIGYENDLTHTGGLAATFNRWQRLALESGFTVNRPGAQSLCATCGHLDGRYGAVVNADGILSSCWETAGKPGWEVGSVTDGYLSGARITERWIACGDMYRHRDEQALATFRDTVDAALLDYLDGTGRLSRLGNRRTGS